jgi:DNA-binding response OmpR family regulator
MNELIITILVVDDEPYNLELIQDYLDEDAYQLFTAIDGEDAWQQLQSEPEKFDLILLDRMLPKMDGMEVLFRINKHPLLKFVPVILQTAIVAPQDIIAGMHSGAYYYLTKPFKQETLRCVINTAIKDKQRYEFLRLKLEEEGNNELAALYKAHFEFQSIDEANQLAQLLANACAQPDKAVIGISELLINAVEHGNLKIGYREKSQLMLDGTWLDEVNRRLQLQEHKNKKVRVDFIREDGLIKIIIRDQGNGFAWGNYMELDPLRVYDSHGRGIAIAKMLSVDEIHYQGCGNTVEIIVQAAGVYM